jgi:hypothetical protein
MAEDKNRARLTGWLILTFVVAVMTLLVIELVRAVR